jgi:hypothetical protein
MCRLFIPAFIFFILIGCDNTNQFESEKYQIYNIVFDKSIGKPSRWRKKAKGSLLWLSNSIKTREDSLKNAELLRWIDSTNKVIDTANLYILLEDTVISKMNSELPFEMTFQNNKLLKKDTAFISILKSLFRKNNKIEVIDKSKIRPSEKYKLVDKLYKTRNEFKEVGIVSFSKISFNNSKDKACVYVSLVCGQLCGDGKVYFLEKKEGKWNILDYEGLWIS